MVYLFIHINKCGGNSVHNTLLLYNLKDYKQLHDGGLKPIGPECEKDLIIFVRDPITRFISSYHFEKRRQKVLDHFYDVTGIETEDLNEILEFLSDYPHFTKEIFSANYHLYQSIAKYLKNVKELNIFFVGTQENIEKDFQTLIQKMKLEYKHELLHLNKTERENKELSQKSLEFLRKYFEDDYKVLNELQELGHLSKDYLNNITNKQNYFF